MNDFEFFPKAWKRVSVHQVADMLGDPELILVDVRRPSAFLEQPQGISGALPVALSGDTTFIPALDRDRPVIIYCSCDGQASSTRVAEWFIDAEYKNVSVLQGGLPQWVGEGFPITEIASEPLEACADWWQVRSAQTEGEQPIASRAWVPQDQSPIKRNVAVVFIDMVGSTELVNALPATEMLRLLQSFMEPIVRIAINHCGDAHDFAGDGVMLYFSTPDDALRACAEISHELQTVWLDNVQFRRPAARFSAAYGPLTIGYVGSSLRRSLAFVGSAVNLAARLNPFAPIHGIAATREFVADIHAHDLNTRYVFQRDQEAVFLRGFSTPVPIYQSLFYNTSTTEPKLTNEG